MQKFVNDQLDDEIGEQEMDDQVIDIPDREQELADLQESMMTKARIEAINKAQKIVKKNSKEIKRLKNWAQKCVLTNNYTGYEYSIKKLREIYRIKSDNKDIPALWASTQLELNKIVTEASKGS